MTIAFTRLKIFNKQFTTQLGRVFGGVLTEINGRLFGGNMPRKCLLGTLIFRRLNFPNFPFPAFSTNYQIGF